MTEDEWKAEAKRLAEEYGDARAGRAAWEGEGEERQAEHCASVADARLAAITAHLAAHPSKGGEAGWQPIETAPKDGTNVLLSNGTSVAQGWWEHQEPYIRERRDLDGRYIDQDEHDGYDGWLDCDGGMLPAPTHWMPLPAEPAATPSTPPTAPERGHVLAALDRLEGSDDDLAMVYRAIVRADGEARDAARSKATQDVLIERQRQISVEGWTPEHDDEHAGGGMAFAAAAYAVHAHAGPRLSSPLWNWTGWARDWWKPKNPRHDLIRAAALLLAEIERMDRAAMAGGSK